MATKILLLGVFLIFTYAKASDLNVCPQEDEAKTIVAAAWVTEPSQETTSHIRRVRLPQVGLFEHTLSCILITDFTENKDGGVGEIVEGGIGHKYAEIRLTSGIGKALEFMIEAYTKTSDVQS